jgi:hypothetical protein
LSKKTNVIFVFHNLFADMTKTLKRMHGRQNIKRCVSTNRKQKFFF